MVSIPLPTKVIDQREPVKLTLTDAVTRDFNEFYSNVSEDGSLIGIGYNYYSFSNDEDATIFEYINNINGKLVTKKSLIFRQVKKDLPDTLLEWIFTIVSPDLKKIVIFASQPFNMEAKANSYILLYDENFKKLHFDEVFQVLPGSFISPRVSPDNKYLLYSYTKIETIKNRFQLANLLEVMRLSDFKVVASHKSAGITNGPRWFELIDDYDVIHTYVIDYVDPVEFQEVTLSGTILSRPNVMKIFEFLPQEKLVLLQTILHPTLVLKVDIFQYAKGPIKSTFFAFGTRAVEPEGTATPFINRRAPIPGAEKLGDASLYVYFFDGKKATKVIAEKVQGGPIINFDPLGRYLTYGQIDGRSFSGTDKFMLYKLEGLMESLNGTLAPGVRLQPFGFFYYVPANSTIPIFSENGKWLVTGGDYAPQIAYAGATCVDSEGKECEGCSAIAPRAIHNLMLYRVDDNLVDACLQPCSCSCFFQ